MSEYRKKGFRSLDEIERCGKNFLSPEDVAPFLECNPYSINLQAKDDPTLLGFPVIVMGSRVKIPREGFVRFCRWARPEAER